MDRKEIQAKLRALATEGQALYALAEKEQRELSDDEAKRIGAIDVEMAGVETELQRFDQRSNFNERIERLSRFPEITADQSTPTEDRTSYHGWPIEEADQFFRAVSAWQTTRQLPSDIHGELRSTFGAAVEQRAPTGANTYIDSEGGFLIPSTISSTILRKTFPDGSLVSRCQQVPITVGNTASWNVLKENSRASGSRHGGVQAYRTAEAGSITGSKPEFEQLKLELKKIAALAYVTEEQLADGPQLVSFITDLVPAEIRFLVEDEIINGVGGNKMQGILGANALVTVAKETGQAARTVKYENIIKMWSRMTAPSRSSAVWLINQDIEPQLYSMSMAVGTGGVPVYMPAGGVSGAPYGTLMGRPVVPIEHAKTVGTVGDIMLVNLGEYLYASKGGIQSAQSMHLRFIEGETAWRFILRNDGKPWWSAAITPAQGSNTLSPFVALAIRA